MTRYVDPAAIDDVGLAFSFVGHVSRMLRVAHWSVFVRTGARRSPDFFGLRKSQAATGGTLGADRPRYACS
jgi:hypothetical protein